MEDRKAKLEQELGKLTYERAKLNAVLNKNAQRCNDIGAMIEELSKPITEPEPLKESTPS